MSLVGRKPVFGAVRPSKNQISLLSNRDQREVWNFRFSNYRLYTIKAVNKKMLTRLCGCIVWSEHWLFTYGMNRFSHDVAHLILNMFTFKNYNPNWHFLLQRVSSGLAINVFFSAFMIHHFSFPSFTLQQISKGLQVNIYLTRKHFRITYTDNLNFFRAGWIASLETTTTVWLGETQLKWILLLWILSVRHLMQITSLAK